MGAAALALEPGEVSDLIETPMWFLLLKCVRRLPAEKATRFEDVRADIEKGLRDGIRAWNMDATKKKLKEEAHPKVLLKLGVLRSNG